MILKTSVEQAEFNAMSISMRLTLTPNPSP